MTSKQHKAQYDKSRRKSTKCKEREKESKAEYYSLHKDKFQEYDFANRHKRRAKQKARTKKKREVVSTIKVERGCQRCGYKKCAGALDMHHTDKTSKKFTISRGCDKRSLTSILEEASRCEIVCANCHREEHWSGG